jgi:AcrR family transcriptional regulator
MLMYAHMKVGRAYVMRARAESADGTRQRILDATVHELWYRRVNDVRLEDIAARADVSVQTVLRIFGSKAALIGSAWDPLRDRILGQRESAEPGDVEGTVTALFDHYEEMGDFVIRNLADEQKVPELGEWLERGRRAHRASIEHQFAPQLAGQGTDTERLLDCLVVACDVYTWQLLRRDMGRSREDAEARVRHMVAGILGRT